MWNNEGHDAIDDDEDFLVMVPSGLVLLSRCQGPFGIIRVVKGGLNIGHGEEK